MTRQPSKDVPDAWPRGMRLQVAAAYVGLSETAFERAAGLPAPVWLTEGRKIWLREDLDGWLDVRAGRAQPSIKSHQDEWATA